MSLVGSGVKEIRIREFDMASKRYQDLLKELTP